jgi:hypothetical protein
LISLHGYVCMKKLKAAKVGSLSMLTLSIETDCRNRCTDRCCSCSG